MDKSFPSDFYITAATVIPVLFLAMIVQGGAYEAMLRTARTAAQRLPRRQRDYAAAVLLPAAAWVSLIAGLAGEADSLIGLYNRTTTSSEMLFILIATLFLLVVVAAAPMWKFWHAWRAIDRQQLMSTASSGQDPGYGWGAGQRPLWTKRDRDAERIRIVLRDAGCREIGVGRDGFVVEDGHNDRPFLVGCTMRSAIKAAAELTRYTEALRGAGFRVEADPALDHALQVWVYGAS